MKILMLYAKNEYTTGVYFENYFKRSREHKIMSAGFNKPGLKNTTDLQTPQKVVITDILSKCPEKPDFIFAMQGFTNMEVYGIESIDIPTVYYGIDTHTENKDYIFNEAEKYKYVFFAQQKGCYEFEEVKRRKAIWLPCAAEPFIHKPMNLHSGIEYDIAFIGGTDLKEAHKKRRDLLKQLMTKYKVFVGNAWGLFLTLQYNKAKIVFNCSFNDDVNMRIFEALACKRALLTDKLSIESGLNELFLDGTDIMTYENDIMEKARLLLTDDKLREKIAESGYKKVIENHTYAKRSETICQMIKNNEKTK